MMTIHTFGNESSSGDGNGNGTGTGTMTGSGRGRGGEGKKRKKPHIGRQPWCGKRARLCWVEREKKRSQQEESSGSVAADPDNLENRKEAGSEAQGTQNCAAVERV